MGDERTSQIKRNAWQAIGVFAAGAIFVIGFIILLPEPGSQFTGRPYSQYGYRPGGSGCDPENLAKLKGPAAMSEHDRCSEAAEEHRLKAQSLEQQWRSTLAAETVANLTLDQIRYAVLGTLVGFATLAIAFFAYLNSRNEVALAKRAASFTEESTKRQLRAYLSIQPVGFARTPNRTEAFAKIKNSGNTPARNIKVHARGRVENGVLDAAAIEAAFANLAADDETEMVIVSGQELARSIGIQGMTDQQEIACRQSAARLYLLGRVDYEDVFGEQRHTWFCHQYEGQNMHGVIYRHGNRAD